jgi:hypothetical protein
MKQLEQDTLLYLIHIIPLLIIGLVFLILFYKAISGDSVQQFKSLTLFVSAIAIIAHLLIFFTPSLGLYIIDNLPLRISDRLTNPLARFILRWGFILFFVSLFLVLLWRNNLRLIKCTWIVFVIFNLPEIVLDVYFFSTWIKPAPAKNSTTAAEIIFSHINYNRERYLIELLYPLFWTLISLVLVKKITNVQNKKILAG